MNVFLGLGLPWSIGAIFWALNGVTDEWKERYPQLAIDYPEGGFAVPAGDLGFSVSVFTVCAMTVLGVIILRRKLYNAELGGPPVLKRVTSVLFVGLWLTYIGLSSWKTISSLPAH